MDIWLIRHTSVAIEPGICYGRSEVALSDTFENELNLLKPQLPSHFDHIISSPLERCTRLAGTSGEFDTDARLLEYDFGDWEMSPWQAIDQSILDQWMQNFTHQPPPNGETLVAMQARIDDFLVNLRRQTHQQILIVTHAGVIRCIWAHVLQIPLAQIFKIHVGYGTVLRCSLGENPDHDIIYPANQQ